MQRCDGKKFMREGEEDPASGRVGEEDAPCCSSRVMDPSCLLTTDEGESGTQMRLTKHRTQRSNLRAHTVKAHKG